MSSSEEEYEEEEPVEEDWGHVAKYMIDHAHGYPDQALVDALRPGFRHEYPAAYLIRLVAILREKKLPVSFDYALMDATLHKNYKIMRWLIDVEKVNPNATGKDHIALYGANYNGMQILLERGADPDGRPGYYGSSVTVHLAGHEKKERHIALLLRYGAEPIMPRFCLPQYVHQILRARYLPILLSPRIVPRIGRQSALQMLPTDIVRLVGVCF